MDTLQALADIHSTLKGIQGALEALDPKALGALKQLPGIRKALVVIAKGQEEMLDMLESAPGRVAGDDREEEDDSDDDNDDDREDSGLEDAVEDDEVEEEDHGNGDTEALVPEVLPAGPRRSADAVEGS